MGREMIKKWLGAVGVMLVMLVSTACETTQPAGTNAPVGKPQSVGTVTVRAGDKIKVEFSGAGSVEAAGLKTVETEVKEDGNISLELVGLVKVAGKTLGDIEKEIKAAYVPKYFLNLNVVVTGPDKVYYVGGQVKQPPRGSAPRQPTPAHQCGPLLPTDQSRGALHSQRALTASSAGRSMDV